MTASRRRDRYAARCVNLVLIATRIAVLGARSAPNTGTQPTVLRGYQGQSRWLGGMCAAAALVGAISPGTRLWHERWTVAHVFRG